MDGLVEEEGRRFLRPNGAFVYVCERDLVVRNDFWFDDDSGSETCLRELDCSDLRKSWRKEARHATMTAESFHPSVSRMLLSLRDRYAYQLPPRHAPRDTAK